jgi:hypothetical protein
MDERSSVSYLVHKFPYTSSPSHKDTTLFGASDIGHPNAGRGLDPREVEFERIVELFITLVLDPDHRNVMRCSNHKDMLDFVVEDVGFGLDESKADNIVFGFVVINSFSTTREKKVSEHDHDGAQRLCSLTTTYLLL